MSSAGGFLDVKRAVVYVRQRNILSHDGARDPKKTTHNKDEKRFTAGWSKQGEGEGGFYKVDI